MPSIIYSMVYFNNRVVVDYTNERFVGNFRDTACKLLAKILASKKGDKASYTMQKHTFNFKNINNVWFMCMADETYGKQMPFVFLNELADSFFKSYPNPEVATDFPTFSSQISQKVAQFSSPDESDKVNKAQQGLDDLRNIVSTNMDHAVHRTVAIESLADSAQTLKSSSTKFKKEAKVLKERLCWSNIQLRVISGAVIMFVLYFFIASFCGLNLRYC